MTRVEGEWNKLTSRSLAVRRTRGRKKDAFFSSPALERNFSPHQIFRAGRLFGSGGTSRAPALGIGASQVRIASNGGFGNETQL